MDEDLEKCVIETMSVVSSVCFHGGDKTHKTGFYDNLRFSGVSSIGDWCEAGGDHPHVERT